MGIFFATNFSAYAGGGGCFSNSDCDDFNACTIDSCNLIGNSCIPNLNVDCNDNDECTIDNCEVGSGCYYTAFVCDDESQCTLDSCESVNGCFFTAIECDDEDDCTLDSCDAFLGCFFTPVVCDDEDLCTIDECIGGVCDSSPMVCDDEDICTNDSCVGGQCIYDTIPGCVDPCDTLVCNDNDACTIDTCTNGACSFTPIDCDDEDACTVDDCVQGQCTHTPVDCDDEDICTTDECIQGQCVHTPIPNCCSFSVGRISGECHPRPNEPPRTYSVLNLSGCTYQWTVTGGTSQQDQIYPWLTEISWGQAGEGSVEVVVTCGSCSITVSLDVIISDTLPRCTISGIDEVSNLDFSIYPNPSNGSFTIQTEDINAGSIRIEVFNLLGKVVYSLEEMASPSYTKDVKLDAVSGIYFVRLNAGQNTVVRKVIIK